MTGMLATYGQRRSSPSLKMPQEPCHESLDRETQRTNSPSPPAARKRVLWSLPEDPREWDKETLLQHYMTVRGRHTKLELQLKHAQKVLTLNERWGVKVVCHGYPKPEMYISINVPAETNNKLALFGVFWHFFVYEHSNSWNILTTDAYHTWGRVAIQINHGK